LDPVSSVIVQVLPPPHVTWLSTPVVRVHSLVPAQLDVQFELQLPAHTDFPSQVFVHPVPHVRSHWLFESQWNVTSLGAVALGAPPSVPASIDASPNVHVPPLWHEQLAPVQEQSPEQNSEFVSAPLEPHEAGAASTIKRSDRVSGKRCMVPSQAAI
jgi:hypothetical protein